MRRKRKAFSLQKGMRAEACGPNVLRASFAVLFLSVFASACGGDAGLREPLATVLVTHAAEDVNPDREGRPSPVVIRLFGQRDESEFARLELEELLQSDFNEVSAWATFQRELILVPGASVSEELLIPPETRRVGVVAGFREFCTGVFRDERELPKDRKDRSRAPERIEVSVTGKVVRLEIVP